MDGDAFVSSIVLCTFYIIVLPSFDDAPDLCGIVDAGAYELASFVLPPTPSTQQHTADAATAAFFRSLATM